MTDEPSGGDLSRLRQLNALSVLRVLRDEKPLTLTATRLAAPTTLPRAGAGGGAGLTTPPGLPPGVLPPPPHATSNTNIRAGRKERMV